MSTIKGIAGPIANQQPVELAEGKTLNDLVDLLKDDFPDIVGKVAYLNGRKVLNAGNPVLPDDFVVYWNKETKGNATA